EERGVPVRPVAGRVADARGVRDPEVGHGGPVGRVPKLRVVRKVPDDRDLVVARHGAVLPFSCVTPRTRRGKRLPWLCPGGAGPYGGSPRRRASASRRAPPGAP